MASNRRILFVHAAPGIPLDGHGGASRHLREDVRAMARLGHAVTLVARRTTRRPGAPPPDLPCELVAYPQGTLPGVLQRLAAVDESVYDTRLARFLATLAARVRPTLIYERFSLFSTAGMTLARRLRVPGVLEVNAPLLRERTTHEGLRAGPLGTLRERQILRTASRVVVVSRALADYAAARGVARDRIRVIPNGVDTEAFAPRPRPAGHARWPDELAALRGRFVVGFCGSLKPWHDVDTLLAALAHDCAPAGAGLLVIGDGPGAATLKARAAELGLDERVVWAGRRAEAEVPDLLSRCDVACVPSPAWPSFYFSPLKLLEAMALGLPVVASDVGDAAVVAAGGDAPAALLVPPEDPAALGAALARIATEPGLGAALGTEGRRRAEGHRWEDVIGEALGGL